MEDRRPREREVVLAPNEFAYVLDTTKGHVNCYVGPNKTSLAQTDQSVAFNPATKRFEAVELDRAVQLHAIAPANWYMILKNPARDNAHPPAGVASNLVELQVGRKINVAGPASFALWPGQMVKVIAGHRLQSNQYLEVRVYDAEAANADPSASLGRPIAPGSIPPFVVGGKHVIRGSDVSFYIPPTGVEVVPDADGRYVRDAVTLQRLEYCVLVGEDGRKRYVRGEAVVFPEPTQRFLERRGQRRFRAIELSELTGIHVKVTAPYAEEDGTARTEGEELFLTGKNRLYFPRDEHALIRYGAQELHHAIACPAGDGRYVLQRDTGEVRLVRGPMMFLPDPRREVLVRRVLTDRECGLMFPGNAAVLEHNRSLRGTQARASAAPELAKVAAAPGRAAAGEAGRHAGRAEATFEGDEFERGIPWQPLRTITLDTRYEGAVSVDVWSGFAAQVVDRRGGRKVVVGPATVLLEYDETLEALSLSTGTPKSADKLLSTAFLQVSGNQVSDRIELVTDDLVQARVHVKYRVGFEGDPALWFGVDNYVKLLCDHASSIIKGATRGISIRDLRARITEVVRDAVLGRKPDGQPRPGLRFAENGMHVHDVEVLDLTISDPEVDELLSAAQHHAIRAAIAATEKETALDHERRRHAVERELAREGHATQVLQLELEADRNARAHTVGEQRETQRAALARSQRGIELEDAEGDDRVRRQRVATLLAEHEAQVKRQGDEQRLELALLEARVDGAVRSAQAFTPELVAAVQRLGDAQLLSSLAENSGELAAVEGKGLLETARRFLDFVPATTFPALRSRADGSGDGPGSQPE